MSFSQSFSFGDDTLDQLDVCGTKVPAAIDSQPSQTPKQIGHTQDAGASSRMPPPADIGSPDPRDAKMKNAALDVIDESPTDKKDVTLGRSIRERLKYASTAKKHQRKHMRRSKSDPLSKDDDASLLSSIDRTHAKSSTATNAVGTLLDSSDEWMAAAVTASHPPKSKSKLCDRFGSSSMDDMDSFLKCVDTQPNANHSRELIAISSSDEDPMQVSAIERMMHDLDATGDATFDVVARDAGVRLEESADLAGSSANGPTSCDNACDASIAWDDSAFFNNLNGTLGGDGAATASDLNDSTKAASNVDILVDADCNVSVQHVDQVADDELESCYLEVSLELSKLNETGQLSQLTPQLLHSTSTRSSVPVTRTQPVAEPIALDRSTMAKPRHCSRDINSLSQWGCTPAIIREYLKRGIESMFEWQVECLSKHEVS